MLLTKAGLDDGCAPAVKRVECGVGFVVLMLVLVSVLVGGLFSVLVVVSTSTLIMILPLAHPSAHISDEMKVKVKICPCPDNSLYHSRSYSQPDHAHPSWISTILFTCFTPHAAAWHALSRKTTSFRKHQVCAAPATLSVWAAHGQLMPRHKIATRARDAGAQIQLANEAGSAAGGPMAASQAVRAG